MAALLTRCSTGIYSNYWPIWYTRREIIAILLYDEIQLLGESFHKLEMEDCNLEYQIFEGYLPRSLFEPEISFRC